jgi:hypothetical protein
MKNIVLYVNKFYAMKINFSVIDLKRRERLVEKYWREKIIG